METIETARLLLRKSTIADYRELYEHRSPAEAMTYLGFDTEVQYLEDKAKYNGGLTTFRTDFVYFHLIEKASGLIIGDCGFHTWYILHARAEIGYGIRREEDKNKGYMKEAILPVVRYGFEVMDLNRIEAFIAPDNVPSQKLVASLGFKPEGLLRGHYRKNGVIEDSRVFGLLREEFVL
ncbi:GNAT family N-acetyltransferase [Taibaiella koreensis]|uniref:GNAT family N-acetyltransferase n=1 Tax=Taibaiella koreensis TaxID=1268548 RepID=UPI000E59F22D|nr:GNAT family protein [Taibaiella koreensis]